MIHMMLSHCSWDAPAAYSENSPHNAGTKDAWELIAKTKELSPTVFMIISLTAGLELCCVCSRKVKPPTSEMFANCSYLIETYLFFKIYRAPHAVLHLVCLLVFPSQSPAYLSALIV